MQPSRRHCIYASLAVLAFLAAGPRTHADTLTIASSPPGATVEIDGRICGVTPYQINYPGGYFHKPHTVFAARLEHSLVLKISKDGFVSQQITLTDGPFDWISVTGKHHGTYYIFKSGRFELRLEPMAPGVASVNSVGREGPMPPHSHLADAAANPAQETQAPRDTGSVLIESEPPGADIYIDGKFVGQTPSTIKLPSGQHNIEVKSRGKTNWQRDLEVWKDSQLTLHPVLTQANKD